MTLNQPTPDNDDQAEYALGNTRYDMLQWLTWERKPEDIDSPEQERRKRGLERHAGGKFAPTSYVANDARVFTESLVMGENSWIAGYALVRGHVEIGAHSTVNSYACISGRVKCGDGVRIASHVTIVGFTHNFDDTTRPIWRQGVSEEGITIEDDVWIGANAVILDGVTVGEGSVIAAGAVVSKDVPPMSVVAGVPARVVRKRGDAEGKAPAGIGRSARSRVETAIVALGEKAAAQWPDVLARNRDAEGNYLSVDASNKPRASIRHLCDAIEIAAAFDAVPEGLDKEAAVERLQAVQDPETGLWPDPFQPPEPGTALRDNGLALYNVLAVGYALECLGAAPLHRVKAVEIAPDELIAWLDSLPWRERAWSAGSVVDAIGTALYFNARYHTTSTTLETLFGWLALNVDPITGLWGMATRAEGLLQPVNGYYRLTRGTYAQFGVPVPRPQSNIDAVFAYYRAYKGFVGATYTACNLLDTIHPLWLAGKQTSYRHSHVEELAGNEVQRIADLWVDGEGLAFATGHKPGLQGTEMWLSVAWLMAETLGLAHLLPYRPKGVHRPEIAGRQ
jgi:acetyltransferase-like isoleucine patch superfamily enzyme